MKAGLVLATLGASVLLWTASMAHAENNTQSTTPPKTNEFGQSDPSQGPWSIPTPKKSYVFDSKGRWGVKFDVDQPTNRDPEWKDANVGAYFRVTPKFKLSGGVGLGDKFSQPQHLTPEDTAPRVHLEGAFKF